MRYLILLLFLSCTPEPIESYKPIEATFNGFDLEVFNEINNLRESYNLPTLKGEKQLIVGCLQHSEQMNKDKKLNHDYFYSRYTKSGASTFGEVVGFNYITPNGFVSAYVTSPKHLQTLLGNYTHIGIATVGLYQTIDLGSYK